MAKLNQPKGFDKAQLDGKVLQGIEPFVDYVNTNFDQIIRAFFNQLTLSDNTLGKLLTLSLKHNQPVTFSPGKPITGIQPLFVEAGNALKAFSFSANKDGSITLLPRFFGPIPVTARSISISANICTAEIIGNISVGDIVNISTTNNQNNSGDFVVIGIGSTSSSKTIVYYNSNGAAETKTEYKGSSDTAKSCTFFLYF